MRLRKTKKDRMAMLDLNENYFHETRHQKQHIRNRNVARFRKEFPLFNKLTHQ